MIQTALKTLCSIYRVHGNPEFTELIHLCLLAFDTVYAFYKHHLFSEPLIAPTLDLALQFLKLLTSIESDEKNKQPITSVLLAQTQNL